MSVTATDSARGLSDQVAEEIRAMMARRRISGRELAKRLGVSPSWVSYRLTGAQPIDLDDLQKMADVLGVAPATLLPGSSAERPPGIRASYGSRHDRPTGAARPASYPPNARRPKRLSRPIHRTADHDTPETREVV